MQVVVCAIAKNEHKYINDWVKHYINLGFDTIFLYDNDDKDKPYIGNFIDKEYKDKVKIINIRGMKKQFLQHETYNMCYSANKNKVDWFLFVDIDEYLVGIDNIKVFLSQPKFSKYNQIRIKWRLFGDDNAIERDTNIPVKYFFKNVIKDNRLSNQSKALVRGRLYIHINSCHYVKYLKSCLPSGNVCNNTAIDLKNYQGETIFINHYMTKTLSEFIEQKLGRGDAVWSNRSIDLDYFFRINAKTPEKEEYLKNLGLE